MVEIQALKIEKGDQPDDVRKYMESGDRKASRGKRTNHRGCEKNGKESA